MNANESAMKYILAQLASHPKADNLFTKFDSSSHAISAKIPIIGSNVSVRAVANNDGTFVVGAVGNSSGATRWLHDFLVTDTLISFSSDGKEIHAYYLHAPYSRLVELMIEVAESVLRFRKQEERGLYSAATTVNTYWSSGTLNFGDWIGPHLLKHMTGRQPIQGNRQGNSTRVIYTVGSIAGWFKRNNVDVWGSGLIKPLTSDEIAIRSKLTGVKIHAVRGKLTKHELERSLGWTVPDVFGDPALLAPDMIAAPKSKSHEISLIPHYVHRDSVRPDSTMVQSVDVRRDIREVIPQIVSGNSVISSSLHGLIIAQAYGIPWVWLDVVDRPLTGNDFKFEDFFTCLDRKAVSRVQVSKDSLASLSYTEIAKKASLPDLTIDLDLLRNSLPIPAASMPVAK